MSTSGFSYSASSQEKGLFANAASSNAGEKVVPNYPWAKPALVSESVDSCQSSTSSTKSRLEASFGFGGRTPTLYYMYYDNRLESFVHWPKGHPMKAESLAGAGFYHTGYSDKVRCFWCDITLHQWEVFDCALEQHKKHSKGDCNFLKIYFPSKSI